MRNLPRRSWSSGRISVLKDSRTALTSSPALGRSCINLPFRVGGVSHAPPLKPSAPKRRAPRCAPGRRGIARLSAPMPCLTLPQLYSLPLRQQNWRTGVSRRACSPQLSFRTRAGWSCTNHLCLLSVASYLRHLLTDLRSSLSGMNTARPGSTKSVVTARGWTNTVESGKLRPLVSGRSKRGSLCPEHNWQWSGFGNLLYVPISRTS